MTKLDKKIEIIRRRMFHYHFCCGGDFCFGEHDDEIMKDIIEYTSQIKKLIREEIMKNKPKFIEERFYALGGVDYINRKYFVDGVNTYESVIKDILD